MYTIKTKTAMATREIRFNNRNQAYDMFFEYVIVFDSEEIPAIVEMYDDERLVMRNYVRSF